MDGHFKSDSSVFHWQDHALWLTMHGTVFPNEGGTQAAKRVAVINFSEHIKALIREVLAEPRAGA